LHLENETIANFALLQSELWLPSVSQWLLIMPATAVLSFTVDVSDECFHLKFMETLSKETFISWQQGFRCDHKRLA